MRSYRLLSAWYLFSVAQVSSSRNAVYPTISLPYGNYAPASTFRARQKTTVLIYHIPYAAPPTGNLRFAEPQPISANSTGTRTLFNGTTSPPACIQNSLSPRGEDCLYLTLYVPSTTSRSSSKADLQSSGLATFLFLHGGGFQSGSANQPYYDASSLAASQGIIVAMPNYRLNVFGFPGPSFPPERRNLGLLDQRMALDWVWNYVDRFGGDAGKVTIGGQSAGGRGVGFLLRMLAAERKRGEQRRTLSGAIIQSGSVERAPIADFRAIGGIEEVLRISRPGGRGAVYETGGSRADSTDPFLRLAREVGCPSLSGNGAVLQDALLRCMQSIPASAIRSAAEGLKLYFPVSADPELIDTGRDTLGDTRLMIGNTADEAADTVDQAIENQEFNGTIASYVETYLSIRLRQNPELKSRILTAYANLSASQLETEMAYTCLTSRIINSSATSTSPHDSRTGVGARNDRIYRYSFNFTHPSAHAAGLPYVFGTLPLSERTAADTRMIETVQGVWGRFIRGENVGWGTVGDGAQEGNLGVLGSESGGLLAMKMKDLGLDDRCWVWEGVGLYEGRT